MTTIFKEGVPDDPCSQAMLHGRKIYDETSKVHWGVEPVVITSTSDGKHMQGSKHYDVPRNAEDYRFPAKFKAWIAELRAKLGTNYDVVIEKDHIHVEVDIKSPELGSDKP